MRKQNRIMHLEDIDDKLLLKTVRLSNAKYVWGD